MRTRPCYFFLQKLVEEQQHSTRGGNVMLGVSVDDIYNAFPVLVGIFGSNVYLAWRMFPGSPYASSNSSATGRVRLTVIYGSIILVAIVLYFAHSQARYGTLLNVHTGFFIAFSVLMGIFFVWIQNMVSKRRA